MDFFNLPAGMAKIILYDDHYCWLYGWNVHLAAARYIDSTTIEVRSADDFASVVDRDVCFSILPWEGHFYYRRNTGVLRRRVVLCRRACSG